MFREDIMEQLPPGFRFHPTDEEVIVNYLTEKVLNRNFSPMAIGEVDLNKCEPWDLPSKAMMGEKEWYFYCHKDKKYPTGTRTNRATESGYWKATGKDKGIYKGEGKNLIGRKKTLVFYRGRAPRGRKTNWVMHEFRLDGESSHHLPRNERDKWVVCRVTFKRSDSIKKRSTSTSPSIRPFGPNEVFDAISTLPPLTDVSPYPNYPNQVFEDNPIGAVAFPTMTLENQRPHNPNNTTFTDTVVNPELNPLFNTSTCSVVHTHNGSATGFLRGPNHPMLASPEASSYDELMSIGFPQQSDGWESCDEIDHLLLPMGLSPENLDSFFD